MTQLDQKASAPMIKPYSRRFRVLIADDDLLVRRGLAGVVEELGHTVVATAEDLPSTLQAADEYRPDVAIVDIRMPPTHRLEGLQAAAAIRSAHPQTGVVVLSQFLAADYAMRLLEQAPTGVAYVLKTDTRRTERLQAAIVAVGTGGTLVDPGIVERLAARSRSGRRLEALTARERQILMLVAQAWSNTAIGADLGLSTRTVDSHITSIFRKLGIPDAPDLNRRVRVVLAFLSGRGDDLSLVL